MNSFKTRCIRKIANNWSLPGDALRKIHQIGRSIDEEVRARKWKYLGHVLRMPDHRLPKAAFMAEPMTSWKRPRGGVRMTNIGYFKKKAEKLILKPLNLSRRNYDSMWKFYLVDLASDRNQLRAITDDMAHTQ